MNSLQYLKKIHTNCIVTFFDNHPSDVEIAVITSYIVDYRTYLRDSKVHFRYTINYFYYL